jgi:hypothetical protein
MWVQLIWLKIRPRPSTIEFVFSQSLYLFAVGNPSVETSELQEFCASLFVALYFGWKRAQCLSGVHISTAASSGRKRGRCHSKME